MSTTRRSFINTGIAFAACMALAPTGPAESEPAPGLESAPHSYDEMAKFRLLASRMDTMAAVRELVISTFGGFPFSVEYSEPGEVATFTDLMPMANDGEGGTDYLGCWLVGTMTGPQRKVLTYMLLAVPRTRQPQPVNMIDDLLYQRSPYRRQIGIRYPMR